MPFQLIAPKSLRRPASLRVLALDASTGWGKVERHQEKFSLPLARRCDIQEEESGPGPTFFFSGTVKMSIGDLVIDRVRALTQPVVEDQGMEMVDVVFRREARGWVLRLYLDKPGGVTVEDCREVSDQLSDLLDVEDVIDHPYTLEVSSPGLDRILKTPQDFMRFTGRLARIETATPIGGQRRFYGRLEEYREGIVVLGQLQGPTCLIPLEAIVKARLEVEL